MANMERVLERLQRDFAAMGQLVEELHASRDVLFREIGATAMMQRLRDEKCARDTGAVRPMTAAGSRRPSSPAPDAESAVAWANAWAQQRGRGGGRGRGRRQ